MSGNGYISALRAEIEKSLEVLAAIEEYYDQYTADHIDEHEPTRENRIVIAEILTNYYTCLETAFLRISQFFENHLSSDRWHQDLLDKMTLSIEEIRPRVLSDETRAELRELMRFRHFKRYYLEFDYDWDKLRFLRRKLELARPRVREELERFDAALREAEGP
jgi:hypothetical protein